EVGAMLFSQQTERIGHVQFVTAAGVVGQGLQGIVVADLSYGRGFRARAQQRPTALQALPVFRSGVVELVVLVGVGIFFAHANGAFLDSLAGRVVPQLLVMETEVDGIQAETIHTTVKPELYV